MAKEAERLLDGSGWLPEPLRLVDSGASPAEEGEAGSLPEFLADDEDRENAGDDDPQQLDAAE
jgi:ParB family chromosome partitioning protein